MRKSKIVHPTSRARKIELEGKQFTVEYNFHAYTVMKELAGISLLMGCDPTEWDAKEYACFLYSGLITHHADVELEFCFAVLNGENWFDVAQILFDAYKASLPKPKEDANPPKPIAKKS